MITKPRKKHFFDIVPFPASKSAGASTIVGDRIAPFEYNPGILDFQLIAADKSKITNTLAVNLEISYDGGETWTKVGSYSELANGSGQASTLKNSVVSFAPMVRFDAEFNASGALASGHGCKVYARISEGTDFLSFQVFQDALDMPDTIATAQIDAVEASVEFELPAGLASGDSLTISNGVINEVYDFYDDLGDDYAGGNTLVDIQGLDPDLPALFVAALSGSALVSGSETDGLIYLEAETAGEDGNDITITIQEGVEEPVEYQLEGGSDLVAAADVSVVGNSVYVDPSYGDSVVEKVMAIVFCDSSKVAGSTFTIQSSFDGTYWWDVATEDIDADFIEKEAKTKLGKYFRVKVLADNTDSGEFETDHNTKINLVIFYI